MQIVSSGDNLHVMSKPIFYEKRRQFAFISKTISYKKNKKNVSKCGLLNVLPRVLSIKEEYLRKILG